jgi:hypothetical protein
LGCHIIFNTGRPLNGQSKDTPNYGKDWCDLEKKDRYLFNPYYEGGNKSGIFNPLQNDYSKEYYAVMSCRHVNHPDSLPQFLNYDCSSIWLSGEEQENGIIGLNYQRIRIHIDKVKKSKTNPTIYIVSGKSNVNGNICIFKGELKLLNLYISDCEDTLVKCGELFGSYKFIEDTSQINSGIFTGIMECFVIVDNLKSKLYLDESSSGADGYWNRSFIGTWKDYKTKKTKKCIWGDYRLPFVFDFDCGDGEMIPCDKYKMNGWESFNKGSEPKWWK